jgi:hypothetical protein
MDLEHPMNVSEDTIEPGAVPQSADRKSKRRLTGISEKSKEFTARLYEQIKSQTKSILSDQKNTMAGELETLAKILHGTGEKLQQNRFDSTSAIAEAGVDRIEKFCDTLRNNDPEELVSQLQDLARRQPAIFLSTALISGFFLGQILSTYEKPAGETRVFNPKREHSIEYTPGEDEEEYYERH